MQKTVLLGTVMILEMCVGKLIRRKTTQNFFYKIWLAHVLRIGTISA